MSRLHHIAATLLAVTITMSGAALFVRAIPSTSPAASGTPLTAFFADGEPGDYLGGGQQRYMTPASGFTFRAWVSTIGREIVIDVKSTTSPADGFRLGFRPPAGQRLTVGTYEASRGSGGVMPGLSVLVPGVGCTGSAGRFVVHQLEIEGDWTVAAFAASFEHHCGQGIDALFGEIHYNSTGVPLRALTITPTSHIFAGSGTTRTVTINNPGTVAHNPSITLGGQHVGDFSIASSSCSSVAPGASCIVSVMFATAEAGARRAELLVTDGTLRGRRSTAFTGSGLPSTDVFLTASANPVASGTPVTLRAELNATSGTVQFLSGDAVLATAPVGSNRISTATVNLPVGSHWIIASASAPDYALTESAPLLVTVKP